MSGSCFTGALPRPASGAHERGTGPWNFGQAPRARIRSFKADENAITIGFRRKWSGANDQLVDGVLIIEMDGSLSTTLFYDVPKEAGKAVRVKAAFFRGGHMIR